MKICIFGQGSIGKRHGKIFSQNGNKVFFFKRNKNIKKNNEINSYKKLKDIKFGLFCICYPTALHLKVFKKIYKYGKNFFIEKPLVSSQADLIKLEKIVKKNKKNIFNGFMFRFDPRIRLIKKIITNKKIRYANFIWQTYLPNWHPWEDYKSSYASKKKLGGGVLLTCSHEIDTAQYLFGKVKEVSCIETKSNIKTNVDNSAFLILKHANGIISNITVDFSSQHQNQRKFEVILNDSSISWNFSEKKIKLLKDGKSRFIAAKKNSRIDNIYKYQNLDIVKKIKKKFGQNFKKISHTENIIFSAKKSLKTKNFVSVKI
tara:strand:+ start:1917 stop:2867 length:951 start_codon:yes stop_codon:yes gene_type:complete